MKIDIKNQSILDYEADVIIANLFEGGKVPGGATGAIDKALNGIIRKMIDSGEITGELGETTIVHTFGRLKADKILIVGLGKANTFGPEEIRKASGAAITRARQTNAKKVGSIVHGAGTGGIKPEIAAQSLIEGTMLALYEFDEYKKPTKRKKEIEALTLLEMDKRKMRRFNKGTEVGMILAQAQNSARDLINEPANNLTPRKLHQKLRAIIKDMRLEKTTSLSV